MFGRVGCFLNGCCYGRPTTLPWGVKFPPGSFASLEFGDTPVHPSQLYNAVVGPRPVRAAVGAADAIPRSRA